MTEKQKKYIEQNVELIQNNEWEKFFIQAPIGVGLLLHEAGINFLGDISEISPSMFKHSGLTELVIPNNITYIGVRAFQGCISLTSIYIPDSVTSIGDYVFYKCGSLTSVSLNNRITIISKAAFANCDHLTNVTIGNSVKSINEHAFFNCKRITSITIPTSVTNIGEYAFCYCESLKNVVIPDSIKVIEVGAFDDLGSDVVINFNGTKEQWKNIYNAKAFTNTYFTVSCLDGSIHKKKR